MKIEHIRSLKTFLDARIAERDYAYYNTWGKDIQKLLEEEIGRAEGRRKVPLVPCRCGRKQIEQWRTPVLGRVHIEYSCPNCARHGGRCGTDREARIAWNEAQKGGEK